MTVEGPYFAFVARNVTGRERERKPAVLLDAETAPAKMEGWRLPFAKSVTHLEAGSH